MSAHLRHLRSALDRRSFLSRALGAAGASAAAAWSLDGAEPGTPAEEQDARFLRESAENERLARSKDVAPMIGMGDKLKITRVETFLVKPRWLFLKIHTNAGITGLGIELDENALAGKIDHDWRNRETYDSDDGSVVDW